MTSNEKNQNDIINSEFINSYKIDYIFSDKPINRFKIKPKVEDKLIQLKNLKKEIENIKNCELKDNSKKLVFSDGNSFSKVMIVGEGPGQKEDEIGNPFVGDAGNLLNKMLKAINIERKKIYITNVVNYKPPNNRKPEQAEITRYANYLRKHISIIDPKILILIVPNNWNHSFVSPPISKPGSPTKLTFNFFLRSLSSINLSRTFPATPITESAIPNI